MDETKPTKKKTGIIIRSSNVSKKMVKKQRLVTLGIDFKISIVLQYTEGRTIMVNTIINYLKYIAFRN